MTGIADALYISFFLIDYEAININENAPAYTGRNLS